MWKILHQGEDCWKDIEEDGKEVPSRFASKEEAEEALEEYLYEQHLAVENGDMDYKYQREEFDIVEED
jgi:hypothetical protein